MLFLLTTLAGGWPELCGKLDTQLVGEHWSLMPHGQEHSLAPAVACIHATARPVRTGLAMCHWDLQKLVHMWSLNTALSLLRKV
jgi:hypothetical protein